MDVQVTRLPKTDQETAPENGQGKEAGQAREEAGPVSLAVERLQLPFVILNPFDKLRA
jgi:hypothetical protein